MKKKEIVPLEDILSKIYHIRNQKILLDSDLAILYGVETKVLVQAVKRNIDRFPEDFMFQLTKQEFQSLRSQFVTSNRGGRRYSPYAFTEQGIAMLSSVLNSERAVKTNITIMRAFVRMRIFLQSTDNLARKLKRLEKETKEKFTQQQEQISLIFEAIKQLMKEDEKPKRRIGY